MPAVSSLFAALLGFNPLQTMLPHQVLAALPAASAARITGTTFFPQLISGAFHSGLRVIFGVALALCLIAAAASMLRGGKYVHDGDVEISVKRKPAVLSETNTEEVRRS